MIPAHVKNFVKHEAFGGIFLCFAAVLALILDNSPLSHFYDALLHTPVAIMIGEFSIDKPLLLWINDGLMAVFFLLVGLEIKREIMDGQLSRPEQFSLPAIAALGGIIVPALIYVFINTGHPELKHGWAIPAATDIAFALGVLTLLGDRVPLSLKITLSAIAIIDDLAAIVIIALFYTDNLSLYSLGLGAVALTILAALNFKGVTKLGPYIVVGIILWACVLKSGVHATLAGVLLAFFIPLKAKNADGKSPTIITEHELHTWVTFAILPLFAFANAGISLSGISLEMLLEPITLGIALGLFLGKQLGVMGFTLLGCALRLCRKPNDICWRQYYGMALLTGVGFTMSLFIGALAFDVPERQSAVRLGVLVGSLLSGVSGYLLLRYGCAKKSSAEA